MKIVLCSAFTGADFAEQLLKSKKALHRKTE
jgi:hypothetical protein